MAPTARSSSTPRKRPAKKAAASKKATPKRTAGRPLRILEVIDRRDTPQGPVEVTIGDRIVESTRAGNYIETAAAAVGINKTTLYDWMRRGARLAADEHEGRRTRFTADERALMGFSNAVGRALAEAEARDVTNLARLGQGGLPVVVETVKVDADGNVVERTTKSSATLPDAGVLEWRLERRFRDRWGRQVEVTGAGGGPLAIDLGASALEQLDAELEKVAARLAAAPPTPPPVVPDTDAPTPNP